MRTPIHRRDRCGSVPVLALVALILMSSAPAQAAGEDGDEGFLQAVIHGRKIAREAYERAGQVDRANAAEASQQRQREVGDRRVDGDDPPSGRPPDAPQEAPPEEPRSSPWIYALLVLVAVGAMLFIRLRRND